MTEEDNITTDATIIAEDTTSPAQPAQTPLGLVDLQNAAQIIEVAVARGAFRANEASQVGGVYDRLSAFIKTVQSNQPAESAASNPVNEPAQA